MVLASLDENWVVWSDEPERIVLVYRPDVFDGGHYPAECLPTVYVARGERDRRPGRDRVGTDWSVRLTLEPDVVAETTTCDDRADATAAAVDLAERFAAGTVDYRAQYQVPRPDYFERLDELTGRAHDAGDE